MKKIFWVIGIVLLTILFSLLWIGSYKGEYLLIFFLSAVFLGLAFYPKVPQKPGFKLKRETLAELAAVTIFGLAFTIINLSDLTNWYFTSIGDEHAFWDYAKRIAQGLQVNPFSQDGVYGLVPTGSAIYQASMMKLLGINYLGWKMSLVLVVTISFYPFFFFVKKLLSRGAAFSSLAILTFSHYLWGYVHTGYANIEAIAPTVFSLFLGLYGLKKKSAWLLFLAGSFAGLGFYTFYSSRLTILLLLALFFLGKEHQRKFRFLIPIFSGFSLFVLPMIATNKLKIFTSMLERSLANPYPQLEISFGQHFINNMKVSLWAFFENTHHGPYVTGSLFDPVSGLFLSLGIIFSLTKFWKFPWNFLLFWYFSATVIAGGFSQYHSTTVSRLNYVLPVVAIIAGVAIAKIGGTIKTLWLKTAFIGFGFLAIILLNFFRFRIETPQKFPASREALAIKVIHLPICGEKKYPPIIIEKDPGGTPLNGALDSLLPQKKLSIISTELFWLNQEVFLSLDACFILVHWDDPETSEIINFLLETTSKRIATETDYSGLSQVKYLY